MDWTKIRETLGIFDLGYENQRSRHYFFVEVVAEKKPAYYLYQIILNNIPASEKKLSCETIRARSAI